MVLHDYECLAHGRFESSDPKCPHGCGAGMVQKIFLKPPSYHNGRTGNIDRTLDMLAKDYNLTDMNNQNGTSAVLRESGKVQQEREEMQRAFSSGQTQAVALGDGNNAIGSAMANLGTSGDNAISQVRSRLTQPKPIVAASWDGK